MGEEQITKFQENISLENFSTACHILWGIMSLNFTAMTKFFRLKLRKHVLRYLFYHLDIFELWKYHSVYHYDILDIIKLFTRWIIDRLILTAFELV